MENVTSLQPTVKAKMNGFRPYPFQPHPQDLFRVREGRLQKMRMIKRAARGQVKAVVFTPPAAQVVHTSRNRRRKDSDSWSFLPDIDVVV